MKIVCPVNKGGTTSGELPGVGHALLQVRTATFSKFMLSTQCFNSHPKPPRTNSSRPWTITSSPTVSWWGCTRGIYKDFSSQSLLPNSRSRQRLLMRNGKVLQRMWRLLIINLQNTPSQYAVYSLRSCKILQVNVAFIIVDLQRTPGRCCVYLCGLASRQSQGCVYIQQTCTVLHD